LQYFFSRLSIGHSESNYNGRERIVPEFTVTDGLNDAESPIVFRLSVNRQQIGCGFSKGVFRFPNRRAIVDAGVSFMRKRALQAAAKLLIRISKNEIDIRPIALICYWQILFSTNLYGLVDRTKTFWRKCRE
jgi:hypothetical protein